MTSGNPAIPTSYMPHSRWLKVPCTATGLCQVNLTTPAFHDDVLIVPARARESQPFPEWNGRGEIVAWNDGECANRFAIRHRDLPTSSLGIGRALLTEVAINTPHATILPMPKSLVSCGSLLFFDLTSQHVLTP